MYFRESKDNSPQFRPDLSKSGRTHGSAPTVFAGMTGERQ